MRKIIITKTIGPDYKTDILNATIRENGKMIKLPPYEEEHNNYRKPEDIIKIQKCNQVLEQNHEPILSEEEEDWFLDPLKNNIKLSNDDLQKLAGFEVNKEIKYA